MDVPMPPRTHIGIQALLLRTFLPVVILSGLLFAVLVYTMLHDTILRQFDDRLVATSALTGALINPADHDWLIDAAKAGRDPAVVEADSRYRRNVDPMRRIREKLGLTYLYTQVRRGDEEIFYILDATEGEEHSPAGSVDRLPAETMAGLRSVQMGQGIHVSPVEYQEQWGLLKTAAAPVYGRDGLIAGTAGADVNVSVIQVATQTILFQSAMIGIASILICLFVTLQIMRRVARPIERLTQEALRIAAGDDRPPADIRSPKEVGTLRDSLARLGDHVSEERDHAVAEAAKHRLADSEKRLLAGQEAKGPVILLADDPARQLFWLATGAAGLGAVLAARAMIGLGARATDQLELRSALESLADLEQGALLSFVSGTRALTLVGSALIQLEVEGASLPLSPGETVTLAPGLTELRYRGAVLPLSTGGLQG
jgi:hypothetical protein